MTLSILVEDIHSLYVFTYLTGFITSTGLDFYYSYSISSILKLLIIYQQPPPHPAPALAATPAAPP